MIVKYSSNLSVDFLVVTPSQFATIQNAPPQTGNDCSALAGTPAVFTKWNSTSYDGVVEIPPDSGGSYYFYFLNSNESPVSITISVATVQVITQYGWGFYLGILLAIVSGSLAATLKLRRAGKRDNEKLGSTVESRESTEGIASTATTLTQEYETATSKRPPASQPILSTGYVDLDKALEGGIPEKFSVVIVSPSFDERDLLLRKIVETSLASGRLVVLVSNDLRRTEDLTARYPTGFYAFSPQADKILARSPNLVQIPGIDNLSDASITLNLAIRELLTKEKVSKRVMIIDILSDLLLHHKSLVARRWLTEFVGKRKAEDFTIIATLNPLSIPKEETESVIDSFDGVIEIFEKPVLERARRFLIIKKMYGQRYSEDEMLVDKDKLF